MSKEPIIIIKFFERLALKVPGTPDAWPQWAKVTAVSVKENGKRITRARVKRIEKDEAMMLIRDNGLVKVFDDNDGRIWDTPGQSFRAKYSGISIPQLI